MVLLPDRSDASCERTPVPKRIYVGPLTTAFRAAVEVAEEHVFWGTRLCYRRQAHAARDDFLHVKELSMDSSVQLTGTRLSGAGVRDGGCLGYCSAADQWL